MTIDEAIKILNEAVEHASPALSTDYLRAYILAIAALTRVKMQRRPPFIVPFGLLPGETKECQNEVPA